MHVVTEVDAETGALLARNAFRPDFVIAWRSPTSTGAPERSSADRVAFLGRHGSMRRPPRWPRRTSPGRR